MEYVVSVDGAEAGRFRPWREDCAENPNGHLQHGQPGWWSLLGLG